MFFIGAPADLVARASAAEALALAATKHKFVDRGDPDAFAITKTDLTDDIQWNDLDLSGIVPAGAVAVLLRIYTNPLTGDDYIEVRKKGNVNTFNVDRLSAHESTNDYYETLFVSIDADRKVEIHCSPKPTSWTSIYINVRGWWI